MGSLEGLKVEHLEGAGLLAVPYVREELDARSLHFGITEIQSRMRIGAPDALQLEYTRTMMAFLMFVPEPRRIATIGLGGGSIVKFCHRHLPSALLLAVEINPLVIALRDRFEVPPDGPRLRVVEDDGARFVAETDERFDALLVDAFDAHGMPEPLGTQRFYDDCADVLGPTSVLAVNLHSGHPQCASTIDRIRRAFDGEVLQVDDSDGTNTVVFAGKGSVIARTANAPLRRPAGLEREAADALRDAFSRVARVADERLR